MTIVADSATAPTVMIRTVEPVSGPVSNRHSLSIAYASSNEAKVPLHSAWNESASPAQKAKSRKTEERHQPVNLYSHRVEQATEVAQPVTSAVVEGSAEDGTSAHLPSELRSRSMSPTGGKARFPQQLPQNASAHVASPNLVANETVPTYDVRQLPESKAHIVLPKLRFSAEAVRRALSSSSTKRKKSQTAEEDEEEEEFEASFMRKRRVMRFSS